MQKEQLYVRNFRLMSVSVPLGMSVSDLLGCDWKSDAKEMGWKKGSNIQVKKTNCK